MEKLLKEILFEVTNLKSDISELKQGQTRLEDDISGLKQGQARLEDDIHGLKHGQSRLENDINELKLGQQRLEVGQIKLQKNLVDSLGAYTDKIVDHVDDRTEALNKRVYKLEADVERLNRQ